ncbi:hypothetical protein ACKWTF_009761 [Chironomus riparius]
MGAVCCKSCQNYNSNKGFNVNNELRQSQRNNQSPHRSSLITSSNSQISTIQSAVEMSSQTLNIKDETESNENREVAISKEQEERAYEEKDKEEILEKIVCNESDLDDNEMNEIDFGNDWKILLIKQNGRFYATVAKCGHYHHATHLIYGTLGIKRIRCPYHGECFNIETGEVENFPGLDAVPIYKVKVENGKVKISAEKSLFEKQKIVVPMVKYNPTNTQTFVIVGGGTSGQICAETLRQNGFTGRIIMICKEACLPYDRSRLSKYMNNQTEDIQLRPKSFYDENSIDVMLNAQVVEVLPENKKLKLSSGIDVEYDKVYIATGSRPRKPKIPGINLKSIYTLKTFDDAMNINAKLKSTSHVVIYGAGFIGMEVAAYCIDKVAKVTIIDKNSGPLVETFGKSISQKIMELFKSKNLHLIMECEIRSFVGINQEEYLSAIKLSNGDFLKADICILGLGTKLNTNFLRNSGILLNSNGSIDANFHLETNMPSIYVGGDIANVPSYLNNLHRENVQNYGVAQYHGKIAALNMIGKANKALTIPFIHTSFFGHHLTYVGYKKASKICINGAVEELKFSAFFFDNDDNVVGVCATQPNKITSDYVEKITQGHKIVKKDLYQHFGINIESTEPFIKEDETLGEDYIEENVCDINDLAENEMKEFVIDKDKTILLIKQNGKFYATGNKCGHYGAPLVMGSLGHQRIRCPWHGACFNLKTGDIEDFPGLDAIPCYKVKIEDRQVKVRAKKAVLDKEKVTMPMARFDPKNAQIFIIIGGGPSSQTCAEALRQNGFKGRIIMICKENYLPYDRIKISKFLDTKIEDVQLRPRIFYDDNNIELMINVESTGVDGKLKEISLSCGNKLKYDKLYIATGARSRKVDIPGINLKNIFTLRTFDDAANINSSLKSTSNLVIYGSSFIALEIAAYCVDKVAKVTIVSRSEVPLMQSFGEAIGTRIMKLFESKNVDFIMETKIEKFLSNFDEIESIELSDGKRIWADICVIAIGSEYNTEFLRNSGIILNENGSITTNSYLETNISDIYVGGDIACSPVFMYNDKCATVEHYAVAQYHGKIAALNMLGIKSELRTVPYFFTLLFGYCITYTGFGKGTSEIFIDGDLEEFKFAAFYFDEEQIVLGMSSCQPDKGISDFAEKLAEGYRYHRDDIEWAIELEEEEDEFEENEEVKI